MKLCKSIPLLKQLISSSKYNVNRQKNQKYLKKKLQNFRNNLPIKCCCRLRSSSIYLCNFFIYFGWIFTLFFYVADHAVNNEHYIMLQYVDINWIHKNWNCWMKYRQSQVNSSRSWEQKCQHIQMPWWRKQTLACIGIWRSDFSHT